jgi:hypothetical protein
MELIDRYVHEVGEHLPGRMRADVQMELRSLLLDALEEHARAAGRPADAELVTKVLREFGPPQEVAARYAPQPQYLIGPQLFPAYKLVVGIVGLVTGAILLAFFVLGVVRTLPNPADMPSLRTVARVVWQIFLMAFFNLGIITLVFAIVERTQFRPAVEVAWDPAALPPVDDPDRLSPAGHVFSLYAILALAILFNFYPEWVGIVGFQSGAGSWRLSLLRPEFSTYMPLLNLWWGLAFVLNLFVLRQGRWRRETRWAEFGLGLLGGVVLLLIILGPPVFRFNSIVKGILLGPVVIIAIESIGRLYRLLTRKPFDPWRATQAEASDKSGS